MKKNATVLMATLTVTAIALVAILLSFPTQQAQAAMINVQPAFTLITSGSSNGGDETLTVLDKSSGKMVMYKLTAANVFELVGGVELNTLFQDKPAAH